MPSIDICWGVAKSARFEWQAEWNVVEFIELIHDQIQGQLAAITALGFETVEYGLYRRAGADLTRLERRMPLKSLRLQPDERLYFANVFNPWWYVTQEQCELEILTGHVIAVPAEGLTLSRSYILKQLPDAVAEEQRQIYRATRSSPLSRVSRDRHCEIYFENGWHMRCHNTVIIDGVELQGTTSYPLTQEGAWKIVLGSDGWPVIVRISRRQQQLSLGEL